MSEYCEPVKILINKYASFITIWTNYWIIVE